MEDTIDIYDELSEKTKDIRIWSVSCVPDMKTLYQRLVLAQLTEENLGELDYEGRKDAFAEVLDDYDYKRLLRECQYTDLLKRLLDTFHPEHTATYKKLGKACMLTAKYLLTFSSLDNYRKHLANVTGDKESLIAFLESFRRETSLSAMHFTKASQFFSDAGLLDIPALTRESKALLIDKEGMEDNNAKLMSRLITICHVHHIHGYELNQRITEYYKKLNA